MVHVDRPRILDPIQQAKKAEVRNERWTSFFTVLNYERE